MGTGSSIETRNSPDYVYLHFHVNEDYIRCSLYVLHTENRYKLQQYPREKQDEESISNNINQFIEMHT